MLYPAGCSTVFSFSPKSAPFRWRVIDSSPILAETTGKAPDAAPQEHFGRSREYWIGWAVAYYQWFSGRSYSDIFQVVTFYELQKLYDPLHEADITKFAEILDAGCGRFLPTLT